MSDGVFKAPKVKSFSNLAVKGEFDEDDYESQSSETLSPLPKKRRTAEDFFTFCNFILEYENYEAQKQESESSLVCSDDEQALSITNGIRTSLSIKELRAKNSSPLGSTGSSTESIKSESTSSISSLDDRKPNELEESTHGPGPGPMGGKSEDSWDLVTCYCLKPFAGRPMIECSECLTWIHLSCAKIRKSNIPEEFICQRCRDAKLTTRRSQRVRNEKRRISA